MRERVKWIDVAKFLGIFAIYLGHYGTYAGQAYYFVFVYHVPLFFFLSGCMNYYDKEENIPKYIIKKFKNIMIPFLGFSVLSILIKVLLIDRSPSNVVEMFTIVVKGAIRNTFFASSLWFLSCLFVVDILFKLIKSIKNKWIISIVSMMLFWLANTLFNPSPIHNPKWIYNIDSAIYYIIYFCLGYICYPYILELLRLDTKIKQIFFVLSGIGSLTYAVLVFQGKDYITQYFGMLFGQMAIIITVCILIWANLFVARLFEKVKLFSSIGQETLFLCGNEYVIKIFISVLFSILGIGLPIDTPLQCFLLTFFLLILGIKIVIPLEKNMINNVKNFKDQMKK